MDDFQDLDSSDSDASEEAKACRTGAGGKLASPMSCSSDSELDDGDSGEEPDIEADPDVIISGFLGQVPRVRVPPLGSAPKCREDPTADQFDITNQPGDVQPPPVAPPEACDPKDKSVTAAQDTSRDGVSGSTGAAETNARGRGRWGGRNGTVGRNGVKIRGHGGVAAARGARGGRGRSRGRGGSSAGHAEKSVESPEASEPEEYTPEKASLFPEFGRRGSRRRGNWQGMTGALIHPDRKKTWDALQCVLALVYMKFFADIAEHTNVRANSLRWGRRHRWKDVNAQEILNYFAIYTHMGIFPYPATRQYWEDPQQKVQMIRETMTLFRFKQISRAFVVGTDLERGVKMTERKDRLGKIRPVLDHLNKRWSEGFRPGRHLSFDEMMCRFKGNLSFNCRMPQKPIKNGI